MPASPIVKEITLPYKWVQLQKTMIPDNNTSCYWSVWYDPPTFKYEDGVPVHDLLLLEGGTAWLMWCPFGDDPTINDSWGHVEEINGDTKDVLAAIESVYGVSFHEYVEFPLSE